MDPDHLHKIVDLISAIFMIASFYDPIFFNCQKFGKNKDGTGSRPPPLFAHCAVISWFFSNLFSNHSTQKCGTSIEFTKFTM